MWALEFISARDLILLNCVVAIIEYEAKYLINQSDSRCKEIKFYLI